MNTKTFSEAMSKIDDKYIEKAIYYHSNRSKNVWIKWGTMAAGICLVIGILTCLNIPAKQLPETPTDEMTDSIAVGDIAPMIYVNDTLYIQHPLCRSYPEIKDYFIYLGKIESNTSSAHAPSENFQANDAIIGAKVYQCENSIAVLINGRYWIYEKYHNPSEDNWDELSEQEKMERNPNYKGTEMP